MSEFDLVAPHYDSTRRPPSAQELGAVADALAGTAQVVEGGIGTGRYARPLLDRGFRVTGVDISRAMMTRAREKGLGRLVQADLHALPFPDRSFDASLIVHVLQLVPDPERILFELARVARDRVVAQLPDFRHGGISLRGEVRRRYAEIAAEMGYQVPERQRYWENSEKVLALAPPDRVREVREDLEAEEDPERRWRDLRTFGGLIFVPPEVHERVVERLRKELGPDLPPPGPRTRALRIASWDAGSLRSRLKGAAPPSSPS